MKKHFFFFLVAALVLGLTTDCSSEDPIYDYAPLVISVKVLDQNGNSFVNSHTAAYFTAIYKGETYPCKAARELTHNSAVTRFYLPHFYGLSYVNDYLIFGELAGEKTYVDEQLVICFSGTRKDTITFSHRLENHKFVESFRLNGQPVEGQIVLHYEVTPPVEENDTTPRKEMPVTAEQRRLIEGCNAFSMNLFRQLLAESADASLVSSPLSVAYLLGMLANGVTDGNPVQTELLHCLWEGNNDDLSDHTWHGDVSRFNELFQTLISWAPQVDSRVTLELADALFINTGFPVYAGYVDLLARYYQADYAELNLSSPEALAYINSWASQKTHGLIPTILEEIPENVLAYLFNALYFKAPWATAFDPQMTVEAPFTLPDGSQRPMQMMRQELETQTAKTETYSAVSVPFAKGAYWMDFFLPGEDVTLEQLAQEIDYQSIEWSLARVFLVLPRFEVSSDFKNLNDVLQKLGVRGIFKPTARFTEMSPVDGLYISRVFQKAKIIINEEGGEAAAVSGAAVTTSVDTDQVHFIANRPFLYCIREASSGAIFFLGTFCGDAQQ